MPSFDSLGLPTNDTTINPLGNILESGAGPLTDTTVHTRMTSGTVTCGTNDSSRVSVDNVNVTCTAFNCKGFKSNAHFISSLLESSDIVCLSETWLRPSESNIIYDTLSRLDHSHKISFSKSSMNDIDPCYSGRPFGGVAIICKNMENLSFYELNTNSDRIVAVAACDINGAIVQVFVSVYFPFYDGGQTQTDLFIATLDALQSLIDEHAMIAPIRIMGDFNAQLPHEFKLCRLWYKKRGFNSHSSILYDFIASNRLSAVDLSFKQQVNYTYFSFANNHFSWIDHVLSTNNDTDNIVTCEILPLCQDNLSDHLPLKLIVSVPVNNSSHDVVKTLSSLRFNPPGNWSNHSKNLMYKKLWKIILKIFLC